MLRRNSVFAAVLVFFACCGLASAQDWGGPMGFGGPGPGMHRFRDHRFGEWWNSPRLAQNLGITAAQKKTMDSIYEQHKLKLIDLNAGLEKQQVLLQPMIAADHPDRAKTLAQIDAVVNARAALEKENADMLFAIREVLTPEQWQKLKSIRRHRMEMRHRGGPAWRGQSQTPNTPPPPPPSDQAPPPPQ